MPDEKTPATTGTATKEQPSMFSPRAMITVLAIAIVLQVAVNYLWPSAPPPTGVTLTLPKASFVTGETPEVIVRNETDATQDLGTYCTDVRVERLEGTAWVAVATDQPDETVIGSVCSPPPGMPEMVDARSSASVKLTAWSEPLKALGRYRVTYALAGSDPAPSVEFSVTERSALSKFWLSILFQPILNALVWIVSVLPGMDLGFAIILLTVLVRLVLFIPTYRSLAHQAELQALQPELQRIQKEYATDKEKQASETMKLYKERGVNPCGSCLPILIQLPVLWAMYYVLQSGLDPANHTLLYPGLQHVNFADIQTRFLGIELTALRASWVLAVVVGLLQFLTMKLTTWSLPKEAREAASKGPAAGMNVVLTYVMPVFIAWLTYTYQAGLGLYWGTSTLFGIGQQFVLKRARERQVERRNGSQSTDAPGAPELRDAEFRDAPPPK